MRGELFICEQVIEIDNFILKKLEKYKVSSGVLDFLY
jgi:hypothetical protein